MTPGQSELLVRLLESIRALNHAGVTMSYRDGFLRVRTDTQWIVADHDDLDDEWPHD